METSLTIVVDKMTAKVEVVYGHNFSDICSVCDRRQTCNQQTAGNPCAIFCG